MDFEQSGFIEGCPHNYYRSMSTTIYRRIVHIIIIGVCPLIYIGGLSTYLLLEYVHYNILEGCPHNYYQSMSNNICQRVAHIIICRSMSTKVYRRVVHK